MPVTAPSLGHGMTQHRPGFGMHWLIDAIDCGQSADCRCATGKTGQLSPSPARLAI